MEFRPIITSLLDNDLYKFTMQQAVLFGRSNGVSYQDVDVEYAFFNRGGTRFPKKFGELHYKTGQYLQQQIQSMGDLRLTEREYHWLKENLPFLKRSYLDFLRGFRFDPTQVTVSQENGELKINIKGPWYSTILWEVPLMAIISELYFRMEGKVDEGVTLKTRQKAKVVRENALTLAEFGTRRRFSYKVQDEVVGIMAAEAGPTFVGTSNVHFAMKHGVKAIGTHAHEWFMVHAALFGYRLANRYALNAWANEFCGDLGIALTDTFTTKAFFEQFDMRMAKLFDGLRHDSGDPYEFGLDVINHYKSLNIDPMSKTIVFSDGLDIDAAIEIARWCMGKIKCSFGIGTFMTNDCGHKPLNMVIKVVRCNGVATVKLSDVMGKNTGDADEIKVCQHIVGV